MSPIVAWLIKSIICSGILYSYYLLFLKDKVFNKYNRFYLLAIVVSCLILPFAHFSVQQDNYLANTSFQLLTTVIAIGGENFDEGLVGIESPFISTTTVKYLFYAIPAFILTLGFLVSLFGIYNLYKKNPKTILENVTMVTTDDAPGTPFSFFRYLFWNKNISLTSDNGKKILSHELVHIKQMHSLDKVFLQITQCIFWINPFIWIIKRELSIIHEFLADEQAVAPGDTAAFAEMMLHSVYAGQHFSISNHLTYSSIKRRIKMINKNKNPKMNYFSRIAAIPVIAALVIVSSAYIADIKKDQQQETTYLSTQEIPNQIRPNKDVKTTNIKTNTQKLIKNITIQKPFVILLDAGHGGSDQGAMSFSTNAKEKDITLAIVKKIVELNKDVNIKFLLTRTEDQTVMVKDRTANLSDSIDLVVSIHIESGAAKEQYEKSGLNIWVAKDSYKATSSSKIFGSVMVDAFVKNYELPVTKTMRQRVIGIWMLQALEVPSILLEAGFMNNPKDVEFISSEKGISKIAFNVLSGISAFLNLPKQALKDSGSSAQSTPLDNKMKIKNSSIVSREKLKFNISGDVLKTDVYNNFQVNEAQ